jgi:hypothetical protein
MFTAAEVYIVGKLFPTSAPGVIMNGHHISNDMRGSLIQMDGSFNQVVAMFFLQPFQIQVNPIIEFLLFKVTCFVGTLRTEILRTCSKEIFNTTN